ncbi:MAG: carbohydrate kinase family protein [Chloroflexota bacterium]
MTTFDVYLYGMTVLSNIHLLKGKYPPADTYQEISQSYLIPGGEGANAAIVLSHLGLRTQLDGTFLGADTARPLGDYLTARGVDISLLPCDETFPGWRDLVLCDGESRTVFGWFNAYFSDGSKRWTDPDENAIRTARMAAIDPFFPGASQRAAALCMQHEVPYVTIDCPYDGDMAQQARAVAVSREFLDNTYPGGDYAGLFERYRQACRGLLIFTFGSRELWFASPGGERQSLIPYKVEVVDTLAAGDSFRAGIVYGLLAGMDDRQTVRFASALAAIVCTRFPSVYQPPSLDEIQALMVRA